MDKIVIIEDDPGIRTVLRLALKGAGFTDVIAEERGDKGLEIVLREHPALVILDLMLPGMDGLAVCREIRRTPAVAGARPITPSAAKPAMTHCSKPMRRWRWTISSPRPVWPIM